jgi:LPS sulfotransferase NodH
MNAIRPYLVCATQRSGSTLLCRLLSQTGVAGHPQEYFEACAATGQPPHPGDFLDGVPATGLGIRDDVRPPAAPAYSSLQGLPGYRAHLARTLAEGTGANGVFGAKIMFNQLPEVEVLAGALPEYAGLTGAPLLRAMLGGGRVQYVWARRRDLVRQAVSMWRAIQTRSWRGDEDPDARIAEYRFDAIDGLRRRFEADEAGWDRFFAEYGITPLVIGYEDHLEVDREATVARVLHHVGVTAPGAPIDPEPIARQADALSDEWVDAYHRDRVNHGQVEAAPGGAARL